MKKVLSLMSALVMTTPVLADPLIEEWKTPHSQGCLMVRDCQDDTHLITKTSDIEKYLTHSNYNDFREEADCIISELKKMGVNVYLADDRYFMRSVAGIYFVTGNNLFLNMSWVDDPDRYLQTLRHEGWHAAQDAMAGTIQNGFMAVIEDDNDIPQLYRLQAEIAYPENVRPWEQEAKWAGDTPQMTLEVLQAINSTDGRPWEVLEPTPLTRLWLENNGYI